MLTTHSLTPAVAFTFDGIAKNKFHGKNARKWFPVDGVSEFL